MAKLVALIGFLLLISILVVGAGALGVAVLVYGYGLTVVSWSWVIGGMVGSWVIYLCISALGALVKEL